MYQTSIYYMDNKGVKSGKHCYISRKMLFLTIRGSSGKEKGITTIYSNYILLYNNLIRSNFDILEIIEPMPDLEVC